MSRLLISLGIITIILWQGCANSDTRVQIRQHTQSVVNPNGESELALLMREMFDDGMRIKDLLLSGEAPQILIDYLAIHTAQATEPEKVATTEYAAYADAYGASVEALLTASDGEGRAHAYQAMVATCMGCHQVMCPGPMDRIKKMYLSDEQLQEVMAWKYQ